MRNSCWSSFPHAEGVAADEVRARCVWVIQCVEKERCGGSKQILDVLFEGIDILATRCLSDEAIVVDGIDVLFPRNCVTEASAGAVFKADTPSLVAESLLDVCSCVDVIVEPAGGCIPV